MGKIAIVTDSHLGARNDSLVFDDYFNRFWKEIFFPTLLREKITRVIHAGDVVDRRKYININTLHRFRTTVLHPLEDMGCEMDVAVGNHDVYHKNTNRVNATQELLGGWDNVRIFTEPEEIEIDNTKILLLPWITQANNEKSMHAIRNSDAEIVIGHLEIAGFKMFRGDTAGIDHGLDRNFFARFSLVLSGHLHHKHSDGNIHYLGCPYEMTFADLNDPKGFHILDTDTHTLTFVENPFRMFHRVFYDDKGKTLDRVLATLEPIQKYANTYVKVIVASKTNPYYFDKFIEALYEVQPAEVKVEETIIQVDSEEEAMDMAEDTLTILGKYVDQLEISVDKDRLKDELRNLYIEASNMEN